jgi:hypothetical protein
MAIYEDASICDVYSLAETNPILTILFVDDSDLCRNFISQPWVLQEAEVLFIDEAIVDVCDVKTVPQFRFFLEGDEVSKLTGTCSYETLMAQKKSLFGKIRVLPLKRQNDGEA